MTQPNPDQPTVGLTPIDITTATLLQARTLAITPLTSTQEWARNFYNGFHLGKPSSDGTTDLSYWRGPVFEVQVSPDNSEAAQREATQAQAFVTQFQTALRRSFTSTNFVRDVTDREITTSSARMSWQLVDPAQKPDAPATPAMTAADELAQYWWNTKRRHPERAIRAALTQARSEGRGVLWFRVASGLLNIDADGVPRIKTNDPHEIARHIRLSHVPPESARVWEDDDSLLLRGSYAFQTRYDGEDACESCWVDDDGKTHIRVQTKAGIQEVTLDLGGRLNLIELSLPVLITPQVLQNNASYDTVSTMTVRNTELAGMVERYGIGIEPPSVTQPDPDNPGQFIKTYLPVRVGAGTMNIWAGATRPGPPDAQGNYTEVSAGSPSYGRLEPVSAEPLKAAAEHHKENIYSECAQVYVLMGADATANGRSREVSIADFDVRREPVIDAVKAVIGEVVETALALIAALAGKPELLGDLTVNGLVRPRLVPQSSTDRTADLEDMAQKVLSRRTVQLNRGVDDPDAEDDQIEQDQLATPPPAPAAPVALPPPPQAKAGQQEAQDEVLNA